MTSSDPDAYWRRPAEGEAPPPPPEPPAPAPEPTYPGPPPSTPPPRGWRTPAVAEPPQPRRPPEQDHPALDTAEQEATRFTYGVGMLAGVVVLILMIVLCARLVG
ncbi:MAG: translation initiation factor 2 [Micromonosporaceae bacterium]